MPRKMLKLVHTDEQQHEVKREPSDELIDNAARYVAARSNAEEAEGERKRIRNELLDQFTEEEVDDVVVVDLHGHDWRCTPVRPTKVTLDWEKLHRLIGDDAYEQLLIQQPALPSESLLEEAIGLGHVSMVDVKACTTEVPTAAQIRVTKVARKTE